MYYWNSRYYDPKIGRSITPDRMGVAEHVALWQSRLGTLNQVPLELNPYVYVANNPLRWIDPSGLAACNGTWELLDEIMAPGMFSTFICKCRYVCKTCDGRYTGITTDAPGFPSAPDEGGANAGVGNGKGGNRGTKILPGDPTHCECKRPGGETGCKTCSAYDTGPAPQIGGNR